MNLVKALFSRRWWWVTLIVLALMMLLARLGVWQLDRLQQRRDANLVLAASLAAAPIDLAAAEWPDDVSSWENRLAVAAGTFDHERQMLLKVQNWDARAGVHLITPLLLEDGRTAVLVDRGWIPDAQTDPGFRSTFDAPGEQFVEGYIALSQELSREPAVIPDGPQEAWYRVDIGAIQAQLPYTLLPVYMVQAPQDDNAQLPYRQERQIDLSEGPHLSYAMQWFIFSIGLGVAYLALVYKNSVQTKNP